MSRTIRHRAMGLGALCLIPGLVLASMLVGGCGEEKPAPQFVHINGLGSASFPNSGSEAAQEPFYRGVLLLHSFEYRASAAAFAEAQQADPDFALAYWGEAMTHNHPLWQQKDVEKAQEVLAKLAPTPEERQLQAGTEREAMYLQAAEELFGAGEKEARDRAYMEAMKTLHEAYPDDLEAQAFYALSILGSVNGSRDFATYMRAAAKAQPVFDANPDHPGAAHYLIHSYDDPVHAPLGLPAAMRYADIAPNAAHAQHMTTHIFLALGMWPEVVSGNIRARDTQDADFAKLGRGPARCGHYSSWLHYGHLQLGQLNKAEELMNLCHKRLSGPEVANDEWAYFAGMRARHIVDTQNWALRQSWIAELPEVKGFGSLAPPQFTYEVTDAIAELRAGDARGARRVLEIWDGVDSPSGQLQLEQLAGLVALHDGQEDVGIERLEAAAAAAEELPFGFGPPAEVKPPFELIGEELAALGRLEGAAAALRRSLERTPNRAISTKALADVQSESS